MGNSTGKIFRLTTFGESHGVAIGGIIDGCPAGLEFDQESIQNQLNRRRPGQSNITTSRDELDKLQILSGVFERKTTGTPIGFIIKNNDAKSKDYSHLKDTFRPSHADFTYQAKYGIRDYRGGGRSSARETVMRVAAGAIAKKFLKQKLKIEIFGFLSQIGDIKINAFSKSQIKKNPFFCPDKKIVREIENLVDRLRKEGDSIGAKISIIAKNVPPGLGEPVFDKLDADLAHGLMGINAVKGVEIGKGFEVVSLKGTENRDEISPLGFMSNNSGGTTGGISTGQDIFASIALKPTSSILSSGKSINKSGKSVKVQTKGRHDPCVGLRATPIAEAMVAITLMDHFLRNRAQNSDVKIKLKPIKSRK